MVAVKLFVLKFGHRAVKMLVGCCGRSMGFTAFKRALVWSILARQHDDPVLLIPAGVERDRVQGKVCVGNLLPGMLTVIAILVDHHRPALCDSDPNQHEPIPSADLTQVTGNGIHHPEALTLFCQILGAVRQQMPATDSVISAGASELRHGEAVQPKLL